MGLRIYKHMTAATYDEFIQKMNIHLAEGYEPIGTNYNIPGGIYCQALVLIVPTALPELSKEEIEEREVNRLLKEFKIYRLMQRLKNLMGGIL